KNHFRFHSVLQFQLRLKIPKRLGLGIKEVVDPGMRGGNLLIHYPGFATSNPLQPLIADRPPTLIEVMTEFHPRRNVVCARPDPLRRIKAQHQRYPWPGGPRCNHLHHSANAVGVAEEVCVISPPPNHLADLAIKGSVRYE